MEGGEWRGVRKIVLNEALPGFSVLEAGRAGPLPRLPDSFGMERMKEAAPTEAIGSIMERSREAKRKVPV
jgi:hypothetical protein